MNKRKIPEFTQEQLYSTLANTEWKPAACPEDERDREDDARRNDARDGYDDEFAG